MRIQERRLVGLAAGLLALSVVAPVQATHNLTNRIWDYQPWGNYDYAPRYSFEAPVPSSCRTSFRTAATTWNNRNRELRFVEGTATVWIHVKYFDLGWPNNDDPAFVAFDLFTGISWADINFNNDVDGPNGASYTPYCGSGTPSSSQYDLQTLALHELGHTEEQLHTTTPADVMYPNFVLGSTRRNLSTHDIASLNQLYAPVAP